MRWWTRLFRVFGGKHRDPIAEMTTTRAEALDLMLARMRAEHRERQLRAEIQRLQIIAKARRVT